MLNIKETIDEQGQLHSFNDEPALITSSECKVWYYHGKIHRENGPAIEYKDGSKCWYNYGKTHRENGPAIEYKSGEKFWHYDGDEYDFHDWIKLVSLTEEEKAELLLSI